MSTRASWTELASAARRSAEMPFGRPAAPAPSAPARLSSWSRSVSRRGTSTPADRWTTLASARFSVPSSLTSRSQRRGSTPSERRLMPRRRAARRLQRRALRVRQAPEDLGGERVGALPEPDPALPAGRDQAEPDAPVAGGELQLEGELRHLGRCALERPADVDPQRGRARPRSRGPDVDRQRQAPALDGARPRRTCPSAACRCPGRSRRPTRMPPARARRRGRARGAEAERTAHDGGPCKAWCDPARRATVPSGRCA